MKKYVVYSAVVGHYDEVKQPTIIDDRFDYILFSNSIKECNVGVWQIRPICYYSNIPTKIARYVKTHPEELLSDYVLSVWIDASVVIKSNYIYEQAVFLSKSNYLISTHIHPELTCIYQEMLGICLAHWEYESILVNWGHFLRKEKFPRNMGTWETGVLYRMHSDEKIRKFDALWWWCIENYSRRDQLSFQYVLWKLNLRCCSFLPPKCSVKNSEHFTIVEHTKINNKFLTDSLKTSSWLLRYYEKHADKRIEIENIYFMIYNRKHPMKWLNIFGYLYRAKHLIGSLLGEKTTYAWELENEK